MALHNPSCEGCESKKYKIPGKARAYTRVSKDCRLIPKKMVCKQQTENWKAKNKNTPDLPYRNDKIKGV